MDDSSALLEAQIPALRRYAYALAREHETADDLVQDCLEKALSRWHLRRRDGDLRAWLFTILRNRYIDFLRGRRRRGATVQLEDAPPQPVHASQERHVEIGDVLGALDQLPEEQRSVILLVGIEDFSYEEAAKVLNVPLGTVMSRLSRARQKLRQVLEAGRPCLLWRVK
ncbi:MAG TPA: sigma-70 family RNA polymerase sigma factor [Stellaceae bacterium]|nr:sigma-70 family RNA polymerase sigma factor [Stellaceae bacterium]